MRIIFNLVLLITLATALIACRDEKEVQKEGSDHVNYAMKDLYYYYEPNGNVCFAILPKWTGSSNTPIPLFTNVECTPKVLEQIEIKKHNDEEVVKRLNNR